MSTINISDLNPTGSELFSDSESYMNELGDSELVAIQGGSTVPCTIVLSIATAEVASLVYTVVKATQGGGGGPERRSRAF